ncbi:hypothetical protein BAUCODRAFT_304650 [Baudoinia panamericana UAMH 10762]|uniref:Uncharacterized protein n=1 Tax=Baudoinia panamericana (strain UAMH 10762) TaxID=717646 RepID=M2LCT1_BAUPA|nr:uncharacterized protein BAUCODRAFT_304650 [Baudoinia panamericana UAMH 10762]EMC91782.1 hypothetical protein BAUCODRAFT_304650 [Baudoinia panamericana UAMH 10762]
MCCTPAIATREQWRSSTAEIHRSETAMAGKQGISSISALHARRMRRKDIVVKWHVYRAEPKASSSDNLWTGGRSYQ